jgi:hypothetical protein
MIASGIEKLVPGYDTYFACGYHMENKLDPVTVKY